MRQPTRQSFVVVLASVVVVGAAVAVARALSYTSMEVVFFAVPLGFVAFLCWQAAMYHVVRIGDDYTEWDTPVTRTADEDSAETGDKKPERDSVR